MGEREKGEWGNGRNREKQEQAKREDKASEGERTRANNKELERRMETRMKKR